ncbi:hypothetical protein IX317_000706 [Fusobacterium sp. DD29]|uniref:hypothetical protein n=1 Tax=unclassified Fusobacterium TaxID=2648384 RepID=UPI001B8C21B8|nr:MULTISPECIES: hypothetical protein [unclassified Fusobacterium]MBR8749045.1 hypothetical protein [Fusobacterium sp. DD29]MBR8761311.1 hypothetical protein [Fusobacterium sp. DD25]MBR8767336.1 hypothetical protein [Fusobacterium sp. DD43]MBR8771386.1 hypothetical protein [Fusobacterium sp. DD40]MBR8775600.1 hypothetical protein [Fusobacterium sp. DD17]
MLQECIEIFKKEYLEKGENLITDNYKLGVGDYFIVKDDGSYKHVVIDKKTEPKNEEEYSYLAERDYLSSLLDMNKPMDSTKQIHSNNYLSFYVKNNVLTEKKEKLRNSIKSFYETLKDPRLKYKGEKKKNYEELEEKIGKPDTDKIDKIQGWIEENLWKLQEESAKGKDYIKIFFDADLEEYKKENERYVLPNIYNSTDFNVVIDEKTFGLPNNNLGLNAKKPFLENKTRKKKYTVPYLLNEEDVFLQKKFFDYLFNWACKNRRNIYFSQNGIEQFTDKDLPSKKINGYYMRAVKNKSEAEIQRFDVITNYNPYLENRIKVLDYLKKTHDSKYAKLNYGHEIESLKALIETINSLILKGKMYGIIFENIKDLKIADSRLKYIGNMYKDVFYNLVVRGDLDGFIKIYRKLFIYCIKSSLINSNYDFEACELFNLMLSIEDSFEDKEGRFMTQVKDIREKLKKCFEKKEGEFVNDREYYFAIGQLAQFLLSKKKSTSKTHESTVRFIEAKYDEKLKKELVHLFKRYGYDINRFNTRFNLLFSMVMDYTPENKKVDESGLLCGILSNCLLYEKMDKAIIENENEEA